MTDLANWLAQDIGLSIAVSDTAGPTFPIKDYWKDWKPTWAKVRDSGRH